MRKLQITLIIFFTSLSIFTQEKRIVLTGKVALDSYPISDVHVINKNTKIGTNSNKKGEFTIPLKEGDTIYFSHLNLYERLIIISKKNITEDNFTIQLLEKTYTLDEITLENPRSIFYVDPEIMTYNGPTINATTLRLPYANSNQKKGNALLKIRSGAVISLDNLINSLNGNNRRRKLLNKLVKEDSELSKIRKSYTDDFFITDLKIKKEFINQFLNYCVDQGVIAIFKNKNKIELTRLLLKESKEFPHKIENEDLFLTKN